MDDIHLTVSGLGDKHRRHCQVYRCLLYTSSTAAAPVGLGLPRNEVLWMLMMAVIGFGVMVPVAGLLADAFGRRKSMVIITTLIILFALFAFNPLLGSGNPILVFAFLLLGLSLMEMCIRDRFYLEQHKLIEKYHIADGVPREGGGGEYPLQDGFGWTNGVVRRLIGLYGEP